MKGQISMIVGVVKETFPGEARVGLVPAGVQQLTRAGLDVLVEPGAGTDAGYEDAAYTDKGATLAADRADVWRRADVILQVRCLGANPEAGRADLEFARSGQVVIGSCEPLTEHDATDAVAATGSTLFSMELMPRITRAQSMDILSSMATIAGYKAVLMAADALPKMFPMMMTAAGTLAAARVFVVGAGVAGLQAIATARRLGAVVDAYDTRAAAKEQIESLGARFVALGLDADGAEDADGYAVAQTEEFYARQRQQLGRRVSVSDVVITTALVPGQPTPFLIDEAAVKAMRPGSVIVDLAAEKGGNCELTRPGESVVVHGVTIIGSTNLPAEIPANASQMYAKNVAAFLRHLAPEGELVLDLEDEITAGAMLTHEGRIVNEAVRARVEGGGD